MGVVDTFEQYLWSKGNNDMVVGQMGTPLYVLEFDIKFNRNFKTASTPIGSVEHLKSTMDIQLRLAQLAQSCLQRNFFNWL